MKSVSIQSVSSVFAVAAEFILLLRRAIRAGDVESSFGSVFSEKTHFLGVLLVISGRTKFVVRSYVGQ